MSNPFHRPAAPTEQAAAPIPQDDGGGTLLMEVYHTLLHESAKLQKDFNALFAEHFRATDENTFFASLMVLGIAFIYGVLHALGPGHGKSLVTLYCLSNKEKTSKAFEMGFMIAIIHALSALLITFFLYFILDALFSQTFNGIVGIMQKISGGIIIGIGFWLIYEHQKSHRACDSGNRKMFEKYGRRGPLVVAASVGLVPCPGVMTVLLFSIALKKYLLGVLSAMVMSIGMGLAISIVGASAVKVKEKTGLGRGWFQTVIGYGGALMIMLLGVLLILI